MHHLAELDLQAARQLDAKLRLQQVSDASFARLAVDPDHGLVASPQILRVDRQVGNVPDCVLAICQVATQRQRLLDGVLVGAGKRGVDQIAHVGVAWMHGELVAGLNGLADSVDAGEIQARRYALRVEIERNVDHVHVAGALAVAKKAALYAIGTRHQGQLGRRRAGATVIVRMHRKHNRLAPRYLAVHPFDHVGKYVGRAALHRGGQVDDALALCRRLPDGRYRVHNAFGKWQLRAGKVLGGVLERPLRTRLLRCQLLNQRGMVCGQCDDGIFVHPQRDPAHHRRRRVVQVHDGPPGTNQRLKGAGDQVVTRLRQHLNAYMVGNEITLNQRADKVELGLRCGWKTHFDIAKADLHQHVEEAQFALYVHRFDQRLVAVAQVHTAPHGRARQLDVGPAAIGNSDRGESPVLGVWLLQHPGSFVRQNQQPKTKRLVAGAYEPFDRLAQATVVARIGAPVVVLARSVSWDQCNTGCVAPRAARPILWLQCNPRSSGSSVEVLMTLVCKPLALRQM